MSIKVHQILTDKVLAMIASGVAPWKRPWKVGAGRPQSITGTIYSGINYMILSCIAMSNGWPNVWGTYKQWAAKGVTVEKGTEAAPLFFYSMVEKTDGDMFPCFRFYRVFNAAQVGYTVTESDKVAEQLAAPQSIIDGFTDRPEMRHGSDVACYIPVVDKINLPDPAAFETMSHYYSTAFHELAHSTGHSSRLNRKEVMSASMFSLHDYSLEELTAELTALFLCDHAGISNERGLTENSAAYLATWHKRLKNEPKMFAMAASRAQKAANYILGVKPSQAATQEEAE